VKSGTCTDILTKTAMNVIKNLTRNNFLILWNGANDVAKNDTMKAFRCLVDFPKHSGHTNVILASVQHRHDLMSSICVNEKVRTFNGKLMKIRTIFGHVSIMEVGPNKVYYTKYGQHLNNLGKVFKSPQLLSVLQQKKDIPISLSWTKDHTNNMHDKTQNLVKKLPSTTTVEQNIFAQNLEDKPLVTTTTEKNNSAPNTSHRLKKTPVTRNEDFFFGQQAP